MTQQCKLGPYFNSNKSVKQNVNNVITESRKIVYEVTFYSLEEAKVDGFSNFQVG